MVGAGTGLIVDNINIIEGIFSVLVILWVTFMFLKHKKDYKLNLALLKEKNVKIDIFKVLVYQFLFSIGTFCLLTAIIYITKPAWMYKVLNSSPSTGNMYTDFILIVIFAPILEELIFRGVLFSRFNKKWGFAVAALVSSILFGLLHIEMAMVGAIAFGFCQCILFEKYDNIAIPIMVHFINNFLCIVFDGIFSLFSSSPEAEITTQTVISSSDIIMQLSIGILFLIPSTILTIKFIKHNWPKKERVSLEL